MSVESSLLFSAACSVGGVTPDELERHFKEDCFFSALSSWSWRCAVAHFSAVGEARAIKAQASQMIMLHSLLKHFFTLRIGHIAALEPQLKSYCAACDCVDIMLLAKRQLLPTAQAMKAPLDTGGRKTSAASNEHSRNAPAPIWVKLWGSAREVS